jgi:hypothetical protein
MTVTRWRSGTVDATILFAIISATNESGPNSHNNA